MKGEQYGIYSKRYYCLSEQSRRRVQAAAESRQAPHAHESSEQIWYALRGSGRLLLAGGAETEFNAGDVVRFEDGDIHGLRNDGEVEFIYLSVTAPPIHFGYAYQNNNSEKG